MPVKRTSTSTVPAEPDPVAQSRQEIADVEALLAEAEEARDDVHEQLQRITTARAEGRATVADVDRLHSLRAAYEDHSVNVDAVSARLFKARADEFTDTTELADALAEVVSTALGGVAVVCTNTPPAEAPTALPTAFLVQRKVSKHDRYTGQLSGRVVLHFMRTNLMVPADPDHVAKVLRAAGVQLTGEPRRVDGGFDPIPGVERDRIELQVAGAWPADLPEIVPGPTSHLLDNWNRWLAGGIRNALEVTLHSHGGVVVRADVDTEVRQESNEIADGVRQVVAFVSVVAFQAEDYSSPDGVFSVGGIIDRLSGLLGRYEGDHLGGLGRITSVEIADAGPDGRNTARVDALVTFTSRVA